MSQYDAPVSERQFLKNFKKQILNYIVIQSSVFLISLKN
jgi:hypothetical protein